MHVLITGGAGFIGRHLARSLVADGHTVVALDDLSTSAAPPGELEDVELVEGSILDADLVDRLVERADTVYHLAAAVGVRTIVEHPLAGMRTNLHGTENVLEACRRHDRLVMIASTSEVYGLNASGPLAEDARRVIGSPLVARWSYAEAKAVDETYAHLYWREYGTRTVIVRPFNIVGPGQTGRYGMVVPRFVTQALDGEPLTVHGDGTQSRCFCHVSDAVEAMRRLMDHPGAVGDVFNIGRAEEITIRALAERVLAVTGSDSEIRHVPYDEVYPEGFEDMQRRVPDVAKLRATVGFEPSADLDEILRDVVAHESQRRALR